MELKNYMWKKNLTISLTLFMIFMVSAFVVQASVATTNSNSGSNNTITNQKISQTKSTADITALNDNNTGIVIGENVLSPVWSHVNKTYPTAWSDGTTNGYIQVLHDGYYLYAVVAFPTDAHWAGIEWNANTKTPMETGHDGWVFGSSGNTNFTGDYHFNGEAMPIADQQNDVSYNQISNANNMLIYEVKRPLDTHDLAGDDVVFNDSTVMNVRFASGFGSKTHTAQPLTQIYSFAVVAQNLKIASSTATTTTTSTTSTPVAVVRAKALNTILVWGSITLFFNIIVINLLVIYHRRST